jgi:hypothetical protein
VFRTIKTQILLVLATLVLLLLSQVFLSRNIQLTFGESLDLTQQALVKVGIVRELERDVIDLQRNVLIYKESASGSAISRFNLLMDKNQNNLTLLEQLTSKETDTDIYLDYIMRMRTHLNDYNENFSSVIDGRTKRQTLYNTGLMTEFDTLISSIKINKSEEHSVQDTLKKAGYHVARAENFLLQYLQIPEQKLLTQFKQQLSLAKIQISQQSGTNLNFQIVIDKLSQLEKDFLQLTQITRGYLFLVNVVIASSANEFLFLTRDLNRLVTEKFINTNIDVKKHSTTHVLVATSFRLWA